MTPKNVTYYYYVKVHIDFPIKKSFKFFCFCFGYNVSKVLLGKVHPHFWWVIMCLFFSYYVCQIFFFSRRLLCEGTLSRYLNIHIFKATLI